MAAEAPLARRRLATALSSAGVGLTHCADGAGVQAITSAAPGALVRRALAALPWPAVAVAIRDEWGFGGEAAQRREPPRPERRDSFPALAGRCIDQGNERARTAGGRQA